jgi:hypothetical protein
MATAKVQQHLNALADAITTRDYEAHKRAKQELQEHQERSQFERLAADDEARRETALQREAHVRESVARLVVDRDAAGANATRLDEAVETMGKAWHDSYGAVTDLRNTMEELLGRTLQTADQKAVLDVALLLRLKLAGVPVRQVMTDLRARPVADAYRGILAALLGDLKRAARDDEVLAAALKEHGL